MASYNSRLLALMGHPQSDVNHNASDSTNSEGSDVNSDGSCEYDVAEQREGEEEAAEEEKLTDPETIKKRLISHLDEVHYCGLFAYGEDLKDAPNPGLYLEGSGAVRFPLGPNEITVIKRASGQDNIESLDTQASATPTSSTTSPSLHGIWEVSAEKWKTNNESWTQILENVTKKICSQFGLSEGVKLSPLSLIFQEAGSSLAPIEKYV